MIHLYSLVPFGQALYLWRLERGLSQQELALRARMPRPNLSAIERGRREVSLRTLRALALALDIRPGVLADGAPPHGAPGGRPALTRGAMERIAGGVVHSTPVRGAEERAAVEALRRLVSNRLAAQRHQAKPRRSSRLGAAWLSLEAVYGPEAVKSLIQRVTERQGAS